MIKKYNYNFSIITPGGCSAACGFCTDSFSEKFSKDYINELIQAFKLLPTMFDQVSVTGGEPTQSPLFAELLMLLKIKKLGREQFTKFVLTTNGWKLGQFLPEVAEVFDHVNISRHAIGDTDNRVIFKTDKIATDAEIKSYCTALGMKGVDVNLNYVYQNGLTLEGVKDFIVYAKRLNATKVTFRFDQNTNQMEPSYLEKGIAEFFRPVSEGGCPVCREACYLIDGMYVTFKNSCAEPSEALKGELYELIFHPDGKLYKDWSKKMPYGGEQPAYTLVRKRLPIPNIWSPLPTGSGGCGSGFGSGGCGG